MSGSVAAGLIFWWTAVAAAQENHPKNVQVDPFSSAYQKADARSRSEDGSIVRSFRKMIAYSLDYVHPAWLEAAGTGRSQQELERLNRHINTIPYRKEYKDLWWPPDMLLLTGGDCEDYAIAKYATLRKAGLSPKDMIILIVQLKHGILHAVLGVRLPPPGRRLLILNNVGKTSKLLKQHSDLYLLAGLNETGWWQYKNKDQKGRTVTVRPRFEDRFCDD